MGKRKEKEYLPNALEDLEKVILENRLPSRGWQFSTIRLKRDGFEKSIRSLPKENRKSLEKFFGLTGGENYSQKINLSNLNGTFMELRAKALEALRKLSKLEVAKNYEPSFDWFVECVIRKVNNNEGVSDLTSVKLVMAFLIIVGNGPKLSCERNPMSIDIRIDTLYPNEMQSLIELAEELERFEDESINLRLIKEMFEMMDFKDWLTVFENYGIQPLEFFKIDEDETFKPDEIEIFRKMGNIRAFKERVFPYGTWQVTSQLAMGCPFKFEEFMEVMNSIHKEWNWTEKYGQFKAGTKKIRVLSEIRTLDFYRIGGLEFTDPREIDFLYLYLKHV